MSYKKRKFDDALSDNSVKPNNFGIELSILFIPFEAAKSHYRRNARNGVSAYRLSESAPHEKLDDTSAEKPGFAMSIEKISIDLPEIIQAVCDQTRLDDPTPTLDLKKRRLPNALQKKIERRLFDPPQRYPDLIFLSEQPKGVDFPTVIHLPRGIDYRQLPNNCGKLPVQKIYAYVRGDQLSGDRVWQAQAYTKQSAQGVDEQVLLVAHEFYGVRCRILGVHLSAKNTSASIEQQRRERAILQSFCHDNQVQFAIGDFNMNMNTLGGYVGARPGRTIYLAPRTGSSTAHEMTYEEQYTSSNNKAHYMGHYILDASRVTLSGTDAGAHFGLSCERSLNGGYYSDHAPIAVRLRFTP